MGEVVSYVSPHDREDRTAFLGMVVFLASWAMMFAALFFGYGIVRAKSAVWPPAGVPPLPLALPAANTVVMGLSSGAVLFALRSVRRDRNEALTAGLMTAFALGAVFFALQVHVWSGVYARGLRPDSGIYGSVFFGLTGFHALHVLVGLVGLAWLAMRSRRGAYAAAKHLGVRLWAMYWHFVGAVWGLMFLLVFVL